MELFSFPSIIQDVYYLLQCAAANFMPQQILAPAHTDRRISDCLCHSAHRRVIYVKMGFLQFKTASYRKEVAWLLVCFFPFLNSSKSSLYFNNNDPHSASVSRSHAAPAATCLSLLL